jgi:hypothetical protein
MSPLGVGAGLGGVSLVEQMKLRERERERETNALQSAAEEDTDNWDDDFEEGISFTKLQGITTFLLSISTRLY